MSHGQAWKNYYLDYLRVRDLPIWDKQSREAAYARKLGMTKPLSFDLFREFTQTRPAEVVANIAVCLIHQATYLLDRQVHSLGEAFLKKGGFREYMPHTRLRVHEEQRNTDRVGPGRTGNPRVNRV